MVYKLGLCHNDCRMLRVRIVGIFFSTPDITFYQYLQPLKIIRMPVYAGKSQKINLFCVDEMWLCGCIGVAFCCFAFTAVASLLLSQKCCRRLGELKAQALLSCGFA